MANVRDDYLLDYIKTFDIDNYGIAIHGVKSNNIDSQVDICKKICQSGLKLGNGYGSINGNAIGVGKVSVDDDKINYELQNYSWGLPQVNVVIAYPSIIENSMGEKLYLGFTPNPENGYDQDTVCSFMDHLCSELGYIPKEFVLGYYVDKDQKFGNTVHGEHIDYEFTFNEHFKKIDDELFETFKVAMGSMAKLSKSIAEGDDQLLTRFKNNPFTSRRFSKLIENLDKELYGNNEKRL